MSTEQLKPQQTEATNADSEIARLARLRPFEYDRQREAAAKDLEIRVRTLDEEVGNVRRALEPPEESGSDDLPVPSPWPSPVDGEELLHELEAAINRHTITADHVPTAVALWIVFSWCVDSASFAPMLAITSPEKRCGKTTLLTLLTMLVKKPLSSSNISPAAVYRAIEKWTPTLLIDEADTFLKSGTELRGVLNSGHSKANAFVCRTVGEDFEPRRFSTWGAKAIAMIGKLPDTLADRSIPVAMRRKLPQEHVERLRGDPVEHLRQRLARWSVDNAKALEGAEQDVPAGFNDRAADNWEILFAIADRVGGVWPEKARAAALALSGDTSGTENVKTMLLADIHKLLSAHNRLSSSELAAKLANMEERPWIEFGQTGKPITPAKMARMFSAFNIRPVKFSSDSKYGPGTRGYTLESIQDAFDRYVSPRQTAKAPKSPSNRPSSDFQNAKNKEALAHRESQNPPSIRVVGTLAPSNVSKPNDNT